MTIEEARIKLQAINWCQEHQENLADVCIGCGCGSCVEKLHGPGCQHHNGPCAVRRICRRCLECHGTGIK